MPRQTGDIICTPSKFEINEVVNDRRYIGVGIMAGSREGQPCCVFECLLCGKVVRILSYHAKRCRCSCQNSFTARKRA